jgi:outer membrane protein OmpA-like peptidoglycan-associated protein
MSILKPLTIAALVLAGPAPAQTSTAPLAGLPPAPPEFVQANQAFGRCIFQTMRAVPASVTAEIGAKQAIAGCTAERATTEARFEAWINSAAFPEAARLPARQRFRAQVAGVEAQIAARLRESRSSTAIGTGPARPSTVARPAGSAPVPASCAPAILYFGFGEATLTQRARESVAEFVRAALPFSRTGPISVAGHDDLEPSPAAPDGLSRRRADAVKALLITAGIPAQRIAVSGWASSRPAIEVPRGTREPDNRRVELTCGAGSGW